MFFFLVSCQCCNTILLFDSFQEPEVQVVLVAVKEPLVVGEDQVSRIVTSVDDVCQLYLVLVPTFSMVAEFHTRILLPGPESTTALIQTVVNLKKKVHFIFLQRRFILDLLRIQ